MTEPDDQIPPAWADMIDELAARLLEEIMVADPPTAAAGAALVKTMATLIHSTVCSEPTPEAGARRARAMVDVASDMLARLATDPATLADTRRQWFDDQGTPPEPDT